jgi:hypothetical protein
MTAIAIQLLSSRDDDQQGSLSRFLLKFFTGFREGLETMYRYEELSHKSDADLAVLNMRRQDLPSIALNGRI